MKYKTLITYITFVVMIILVYSLFSYFSLDFLRGKTGSIEASILNIYHNMYQILYGVILGVLISIPYLYAQIKKSGDWHYNWYFLASTIFIAIIIGLFLHEQNKYRFYYDILGAESGMAGLEGFAKFDNYIRQLFLPTFTILGYSILGSLCRK